MNLRGISVRSSSLHDDILEVRANNGQPITTKKVTGTVNTLRDAVIREGLDTVKVRRRGDNIYIILSEEAEAHLPKRTGGTGAQSKKLLTKKIRNAKIAAIDL
jgi:hypothetical protein